jgi:O-acetyl-ADP-ribose deacetylase (regulator of RNase III)
VSVDPSASGRLRVVRGSIVDLDVEAIVNAANSALQGGGGVDGAIHRAAGPDLALAARMLAPCPPGQARITPAFRLRARFVIHTVGPIWRGGTSGEPETLARCYRESLTLAEAHGVTTLAFPAISTGGYGYAPELAADIAVREVRAWLADHGLPATVVLCAFSEDSAEILRAAASQA